jgi:uncharacterized Rmd1/YagE family protein
MNLICGPDWDKRVVTIEPKGKMGLLMSGGIDSFVLFNLLPENTIIFNIKRQDQFDSVNLVRKLTKKDVIEVDELQIEKQEMVRFTMYHIADLYNLDQMYTGINCIPNLQHFPEFVEDNPYRPWRITDVDHNVVAPFLHLYKYHIIDIANKNNIDLSNTQSCSVYLHGHCGKCWSCKEKEWGYNQLSCLH